MTASPFIETYCGIAFHPLEPRPEDIRLEDIAHALAHQCRFSGHTRVFYSVAEHSVRVARLLREQGWDKKTQRHGLLHDASEAYLVDIPAPLKRHPAFAGYVEAERRLMSVIGERYGLYEIEPIAVKEADQILLATEARDLMPNVPEHWAALEFPSLLYPIGPWTSTEAAYQFLKFFGECDD